MGARVRITDSPRASKNVTCENCWVRLKVWFQQGLRPQETVYNCLLTLESAVKINNSVLYLLSILYHTEVRLFLPYFKRPY